MCPAAAVPHADLLCWPASTPSAEAASPSSPAHQTGGSRPAPEAAAGEPRRTRKRHNGGGEDSDGERPASPRTRTVVRAPHSAATTAAAAAAVAGMAGQQRVTVHHPPSGYQPPVLSPAPRQQRRRDASPGFGSPAAGRGGLARQPSAAVSEELLITTVGCVAWVPHAQW